MVTIYLQRKNIKTSPLVYTLNQINHDSLNVLATIITPHDIVNMALYNFLPLQCIVYHAGDSVVVCYFYLFIFFQYIMCAGKI